MAISFIVVGGEGTTVGVSKPTEYGGDDAWRDGVVSMPCVRRCRFALERTVKVLEHPSNPHGKAEKAEVVNHQRERQKCTDV